MFSISLFTGIEIKRKVCEYFFQLCHCIGQYILPLLFVVFSISRCSQFNLTQVLSVESLFTKFVYNDIFYRTVFGAAMGSPVSAVITNSVMEDVEQRALA